MSEPHMSQLDDNKQLVRRFLEEVVNSGDVRLLDELIDPACVETDGETRVVSGVEGMAAHVRGVRAVYPDLQIAIQHQIAEGEWVATALSAVGTHSGEWLGMAPTHKRLTFTGVNLNRVVNGKIVEHGGAANMLHPFLAAGALVPVR